jgi:hypothetical protein
MTSASALSAVCGPSELRLWAVGRALIAENGGPRRAPEGFCGPRSGSRGPQAAKPCEQGLGVPHSAVTRERHPRSSMVAADAQPACRAGRDRDRRSIRCFEYAVPAHFDLSRLGWERGVVDGERFSSFWGSVLHEWEVLLRYRFLLCYESQRMDGHVTEKLFDCLRCGVAPVHLGAPEIERVVDARGFVDRRAPADDGELLSLLQGVPEIESRKRRESAGALPASTSCAQDLSEAFADTVCSTLGAGATGRKGCGYAA